MTVRSKHTKVLLQADGADASVVRPSDWNADILLYAGAVSLLGNATGSDGQVTEIGVSASFTFVGTQLNLAVPGSGSEILYRSGANSMAAAANATIREGSIAVGPANDNTLPPAGWYKLDTTEMGGRTLPHIRDMSSGSTLQPNFGRNTVALWQAPGGTTSFLFWGAATATLTATGTATAVAISISNRYTETGGTEALVTTAAATAVAGFRSPQGRWWRGSAGTDKGGFHLVTQFGIATGTNIATRRAFFGMSGLSPAAAPTDVDPSSLALRIGVGYNAADTNWHIMICNSAALEVKVDTGMPKPNADRTTLYELMVYSPPNSDTIYYSFTNLNTLTTFSGSTSDTTRMPGPTVLLGFRGYASVGGTSGVVGVKVNKVYIETDY